MRVRCQGQCKTPSSRDLFPEVTLHPVYGMRTFLHDVTRCPHSTQWRMRRLSQSLRRGRT